MIGSNIALDRQDAGHCIVCGKVRSLMCGCEDKDRIIGSFKRRRPGRPAPCVDGQPGVCKDCCIGSLEGHRCRWWEFCWEI